MRLVSIIAMLLFVCTSAFAGVIKIKDGESLEIWAKSTPGGPYTKQGEITDEGVLRIDRITDTSGGTTPPGMVPVGSMIVHAITVDWTIPSACTAGTKAGDDCGFTPAQVVKDGFMVANGQEVPAGQTMAEDTVLPNMVGQFARGGSAINLSPGQGSDSVTPTGDVSTPAFTGTNVTLSSVFFRNEAVTVSTTVPGHYHTEQYNGGGMTASSAGTHSHTLLTDDNAYYSVRTGDFVRGGGSSGFAPSATATGYDYLVVGSVGNHSHATSGTVGNYNGGVTGDTIITATSTMNASDDNKSEWASTADIGYGAGVWRPQGTNTTPTFTGNSQTNIPSHMTIVYLIRVK